MFRRALAVLALAALPSCLNSEEIDAAFCDSDEACFAVGVGGSGGGVTTGGTDPGAFTCGGVVCAGIDPLAPCVTEWFCNKGGHCEATDAGAAGSQDLDSCTVDTCGADGEWKHRPMTADEISDGDPCTVDSCAPDTGVSHLGTCG